MGKPKIRFKGYEDDWEQRKWIDVVDISTEMVNPTTGEYEICHILRLGISNHLQVEY